MTANNTDVSNVVILGSTGSIGTQAIDVIRRAPDRFRVKALSAGGGNLGLLAEQALELRVETVAVASSSAEAELVERLKTEAGNRGRGALPLPEVISGPEANTHLASLPCDSVLNGITGAVGLAPPSLPWMRAAA